MYVYSNLHPLSTLMMGSGKADHEGSRQRRYGQPGHGPQVPRVVLMRVGRWGEREDFISAIDCAMDAKMRVGEHSSAGTKMTSTRPVSSTKGRSARMLT